MNDLTNYGLLGFSLIFGFIFEDILKWFGFEVKTKDSSTIVLFFPAFFLLLAYWAWPLFVGTGFLTDITKISLFYDNILLWMSVSMFAGSGLRLLFDWYQNRSK